MQKIKLHGSKILYISGPCGRERWMYKISKEFEKKYNTDSFYCITTLGEDKFFLKKGISKDKIHSVTTFNKKKNSFNIEYLKKAETKYNFNCWDIWQITAPRDNARMMMSYSEVLGEIESAIIKIENMFKKFKPEYMIYQGLASFVGTLLHNMSIAFGVKPLSITNTRIPGRFTINNNLEEVWPLLTKEYSIKIVRIYCFY